MADFQTALQWTLSNWEDPSGTYEKVPDAPPGAFAIAGINSIAWPEDFASIDASVMPERATLVQNFYQQHFWNQWLEQITSDEVAKRVFDAGVNMGSKVAAELLQEAYLDAIMPAISSLVIDGMLGPATIAAVNTVPPSTMIEEFQRVRSQHYEDIVSENHADQKYLAGWLSRAQA